MIKEIDFSTKHHILLEDEKGNRQPMDEPYYVSELVAPGVWRNHSDGDYFYLIAGDQEALAIDTGYGCGNVRAYLQTLTDKPVRKVANTHDHFDHTANNAYFDCAYMSAETKPLATVPFKSFEGIDFPRDYKIEVIDEGYVFHLGNRDIEVFKTPDHAVGSLVFLDRKEGLLFGGDEIGMPMGKRLNGSVEAFARQMEKLQAHRGAFDRVCAGFGVLDADIIDRYLENARHILVGNEGVIYDKAPFPKFDETPGQIIYKRHMPHPCDLPQSVDMEKFKHMRLMEHAGCRIIYDVRKVLEG